MKTRRPLAFSLGALSAALAHAAPLPAEPGPVWPKLDPATIVPEPAATARTGGPDAELANSIAQALSADESLKNAKITVQPESDSVLLTGVALTNAQRQRAGEVATQAANGKTVVNAIQSSEIVVSQPEPAQAQAPSAPRDATLQ
jgi:hypothetical protein